MHIVHFIPTLMTGGAERILCDVALDQARHGNQVAVYTLYGETHLGDEMRGGGVAVCSPGGVVGGPRQRVGWLWECFRLIRRWQRMQSDVTFGWLYYGAVATLFARGSRRVVWSLHHHNPNDPGLGWRARLSVRLAAILSRDSIDVIYVSSSSATNHAARGFRGSRTVVPAGIDVAKFSSPTDAQVAAPIATLGLPEDAEIVAHVARYHPDKDQDTLLKAFRSVVEDWPKAHLLMVGRGLSGENTHLIDLIASLGLQNHVHLLGEVRQVEQYLQYSRTFVLSSKAEALPVSLLEAMAAGNVPVVTDVGVCAEVVNGLGYCVPPSDPVALSAALKLSFTESFDRSEIRTRAGGFSGKRMCAEYQKVTSDRRLL